MKKFILLSFLLLAVIQVAFAQPDRQLYYKGILIFEPYYRAEYSSESIKSNHVSKETKTSYQRKGSVEKIKSSVNNLYDSLGRAIGYEYLNKKGEMTWGMYFQYDAKGRIIERQYRYNKHFFSTAYEFSDFKEPIEIISRKGESPDKMKVTKTVINSFNPDSNKISSITYDKEMNIRSIVIYTYDSLKKLGVAKLYGKKGKFIHSWNFECNEKQGVLDKKGKEQNICTSNITLENGHTQTITITEGYKSIERKIVESGDNGRFQKTDIYTGTAGNILSYRSLYTYANDTNYNSYERFHIQKNHSKPWSINKSTSVKGKTLSKNEIYFTHKNKLESSNSSSFKYNEKGLLIEEEVTDMVKKTVRIIRTTYSYL